jgi:hypothetical protein
MPEPLTADTVRAELEAAASADEGVKTRKRMTHDRTEVVQRRKYSFALFV